MEAKGYRRSNLEHLEKQEAVIIVSNGRHDLERIQASVAVSACVELIADVVQNF